MEDGAERPARLVREIQEANHGKHLERDEDATGYGRTHADFFELKG